MDGSSCLKQIDECFFWDSVGENKKVTAYAACLIFEKHVYLDDKYESVLVIGISPHNKMSTAARIENRANASVLHLDKESLFDLLDCIDVRFSETTKYPMYQRGHINIQQIDDRLFKISLGNRLIKMHPSALFSLKQKQILIKMLIMRLERDNYDTNLFKLLHHFCYDGNEKTVLEALHIHIHKQKLIDVLCELDCECLERSFTLEIASNCPDWFATCVPLFIKTLTQAQCVSQRVTFAGCSHFS